MEIQCQYCFNVGYTCTIDHHQIPENIELKFIGIHKDGNTDNDVVGIWFNQCNISKVPQGLTEIFPNLEILRIRSSNLKSVSKIELQEYKNCKIVDFYHNKIDFLPGDLFDGFGNLERIEFYRNTLTYVEPNILDDLEKLKYVDLNGTVKYGNFNSSTAVSSWSGSLNNIRNNILDKMIENGNKQILKDYIIGLQYKIETLKKINHKTMQELEQKCQNLEQENVRLNGEVQNLQIDIDNLNQQNEVLNQQNWLLKNTEDGLKQEIQDLKHQQEQSGREILQIQQEYLQKVQQFANLEQEFEAKILNEQQKIPNFCADIKTFIHDETTKDFQIQIDGHEFPVHKFLLAARSPTLAELLKNNPEVENLNLVDISVEIFEKILKFLYNDELPDDDETNFLHLFAASGKLKIDKLKKYAAEKLHKTIKAENALELLNLSNKYEHDELKKAAFDEIKRNYPKMVLNDEIIDDAEKVEKLVAIIKKFEDMEKSFGGLMD